MRLFWLCLIRLFSACHFPCARCASPARPRWPRRSMPGVCLLSLVMRAISPVHMGIAPCMYACMSDTGTLHNGPESCSKRAVCCCDESCRAHGRVSETSLSGGI